jgi:signal transduction histidine kinase/DNA-binding LacI/PurR family transcriptional regulator
MEMCEEQWLGVSDAALANGCDLLCFVGRELDHPDRLLRGSNAVYDLVSRPRIDALVVWTTRIGLLLDDEALDRFLLRFAPLPIVAVERKVGDRPTVLMDNRAGMAQAVSHLVEVHDHRRIAFVRGPDNHGGAQDRYAGYRDALAAHGLPYDPELVTAPGTWNWDPDAAADAVTAMLGRLGTPPDAIAAANDDVAHGVLAALEAAGIRTPDDVGVVGYDNHTNIRSHDFGYETIAGEDPTAAVRRRVNVHAGTLELTTIRAPFAEMGRCALEVALAMVRGEPVPAVQTMATELVVRRTCGCFPAVEGPAAPAGRSIRVAPVPSRSAVVADVRAALRAVDTSLPGGWAERLVTAFLDEVHGRAEGAFLPMLAEYVRMSVRTGGSPAVWWRALFALRRLAPAALREPYAENVWLRVQLLLAESTQRLADYRHLLDEKRDQTVREAGLRLIGARDLHELTEALVVDLPRLGIPGAAIAINRPVLDEEGDEPRPVFAYEHGERSTPGTDLFPVDRPDAYSMVVAPLYAVEGQLGFVAFELGPRIGWMYEAMQGQVSSGLRGVVFVQRERRAVAEVEDARRRIERAHADLEQRVVERTAELADANRILTEQIAERELAEQRQATLEAQLRHAQKMEAIGRLAGGVAHDFNNILTIINGNAEFVLRSLAPDDPRRPDLEDIRYAGERATNLTDQLLAFTRQREPHPRRLDLNQAVTNVQGLLRRLIGEDIELTSTLPDDVVPVWADAGQLEQIIVNLAANARDAMPQGGTLHIETRNVRLDGGHLGRLVDVPAGDYVLLRMRDTGIGMDEAVQANVFEPFFTTKPPGSGTGLGLATVFGIVARSGGQLDLTSAPGAGTTIDVYLPRAPADVETVAQPPTEAPDGGSETILLVEDDERVRAVTRRSLSRYGYAVLEAGDGHEALLVAKGFPGRVDLVITDVVMPRLGGPQFVKQLEEVRPGCTVLYISGYTDGYVGRERLAGATVALLKKPFTEDNLLRRVRSLLDVRP